MIMLEIIMQISISVHGGEREQLHVHSISIIILILSSLCHLIVSLIFIFSCFLMAVCINFLFDFL